MEENTCKECVYFFCHYIRDRGRYRALYCGHCIYPRLKKREMGAKACQYFRSVKHPAKDLSSWIDNVSKNRKNVRISS